MEDYVITISRTFGSGGKSIALDLADKLGINCYNAEIKKTAYEQMGSDIFDLSTRRHRLMGPDAKSFEPDDDLFERQAKIIKNLAESESCIIVGRCADRVLDGYPNVFRFFVDAPFEYRINRLVNKWKIGREEAIELEAAVSGYRREFYEHYTRKVFGAPENYDMCFDTSVMDPEQIGETILEYVINKLDTEE
ncbi:MAG: cytidylate kinase-like family protein [Clostridiales bacterium]|nr:cytidylate kinase-like family protein [Clostridiales bacterium]